MRVGSPGGTGARPRPPEMGSNERRERRDRVCYWGHRASSGNIRLAVAEKICAVNCRFRVFHVQRGWFEFSVLLSSASAVSVFSFLASPRVN